MNGSFFFGDGEESSRSIELRILPHGEVEVEETFVIELSVLYGELDIDPQAGSVTLKVLCNTVCKRVELLNVQFVAEESSEDSAAPYLLLLPPNLILSSR